MPRSRLAKFMPSNSISLDHHSADLIRVLQKIIRVPTVNPPGEHYDELSQILVDELNALGLKTQRFPIPAHLLKKRLPDQTAFPRYNILARWDVGAPKTIHFNAHYDVVPVSGTWRHGDPFSGKVEKGWIYGRGTADMKGSIASLLTALRALRAAGTPPRCNVEVSFTADEETDSALGTEWVVNHAKLKADYAIVMEGCAGLEICCGHNGVVWLQVTVHGRAAHGSTPQKGINALEKMSALVLALQKYQRGLSRKRWKIPGGKVMTPTLNVGGVFESGVGGKINTVPAMARFTLDRRVLPVENHAAAEKELRKFITHAARQIPDCKITIDKISENFSCLTDPRSSFQKAVATSIARVRKSKPIFRVSTGFNDMYFFAEQLRVPTVGYGPDGVDYHAVDERAPLNDLMTTAKIYVDLLTTFEG